jgi:hypothetical protein
MTLAPPARLGSRARRPRKTVEMWERVQRTGPAPTLDLRSTTRVMHQAQSPDARCIGRLCYFPGRDQSSLSSRVATG